MTTTFGTSVRKTMCTSPTDCHRLTRLIQRMLASDALCQTKGDWLLAEIEAAHHCEKRGDKEMVCHHVEKVMCLTKALVRSDALDLTDGHTVLETARDLLATSSRLP